MITRASNGTVLEPGLDRKGSCMTTTTPCAHLSVLFLDLSHYSGLAASHASVHHKPDVVIAMSLCPAQAQEQAMMDVTTRIINER